jgi:hypothetical protein
VKTTLYKGRVMTIKGQCDNFDFYEKVRIEQIRQLYDFRYTGTYHGYYHTHEDEYDCVEDPATYGRNYTHRFDSIEFKDTCCIEGHARARHTTNIHREDFITVHHYKTVYRGLEFHTCRQTVYQDVCETLTEDGWVKIFTTAPIPQLPTDIGVVMKGSKVVKVFADPRLDRPSWESPFQYRGVYHADGYVHERPPGDYRINGVHVVCDDYTARTQTAVQYDVTVVPCRLPQVLDDQYYPSIHTQNTNIRILEIEHGDEEMPTLRMETEYIGALPNTQHRFDYQMTTVRPDPNEFPFSEITLESCTYALGDLLNSFCILQVHWSQKAHGFALLLDSQIPSSYQISTPLIAKPHSLEYKVRIIAFHEVDKMTFNVKIGDKELAPISTDRLSRFNFNHEGSSVGLLQDVSYTYSSGDTTMDNYNSAMAGGAIFGLFMMVLATLLTCGLAIRNHVFYDKLRMYHALRKGCC